MSLPPFSLQDVARYCRVNHLTVEKWIEQGRLRGVATRSGDHVVPRSDFRAFLQVHGLPVDSLFFATGGQPKRILVITDKQQLVQFVVESLCRASVAIEIVSAVDSDEAQCQATASHPDLVILGDTFHAADGLRMCRWLRHRASFERTKVLVIVDGNGDDRHRRRICFAADEVVRQPLDGGAFRLQVYSLLMDSDVPHSVSAGVPERSLSL